MSADASSPAVPATPLQVDPDTVFFALGDPTRRRILMALAAGVPKTVTELLPATQTKFDATRKHLQELRKAKMVTMAPDPVDSRRQRYSLPPGVIADLSQPMRTLDFGCVVVRWTPAE
jgi:DNA-binding transcriptional ArsR family regulator